MKLFIVLAVLVGVSTAFPATNAPDPDLLKDFQDFLACVNTDAIAQDVADFEQNDAEVQHVAQYITTDAFKDHVRAIDKEPAYLAILSDLDSYYVGAYQQVNELLEFLGIEKIVPPSMSKHTSKGLRGFQDLLNKIENEDIDQACITNLYNDKINVKDDTAFKRLDAHLHTDDFANLVAAFKSSDAFTQAIAAFHKEGLNFASFVELMAKLFHWSW